MKRLFGLAAIAALAGSVACGEQGSNDAAGDESDLTSGEASLVVPLIDEKKQLLSRFNAQAKAKGLNELPDTVEVKNGADGKKLDDYRMYFDDKIMPAVGAKDQAMPSWGPDSYTNWSKKSKTPGLCYKGNPTKVTSVIESGTDTAWSDQLVIQGWRYKTKKTFADGAEDYESDFPDVWKEWRGDGTAVLVIFTQGDDGDDLTAAIIPRCK